MADGTALLLLTLGSIALLLFLILYVRLHAFLALMLTSMVLGLACGMEPAKVIPSGFPALRTALMWHTASHNMCAMKNITLSIDEKVLRAARRYAAERESSVNSLVREFLTGIAEREDRARKARRQIEQLSRCSKARLGPKTWDRESLHER